MLLNTILFILIIEFIIDFVVEYINFKHQSVVIPEKLRDVYDTEKYAKSQAYQAEQTKFGFLTNTFSFILSLLMLAFGGFGSLNTYLVQFCSHPIALALLFSFILFIINDIITLPFSLYATFIIEEKYGFNKMTAKTFILDKIKGYGLAIVLGGVLISALLYTVMWLGPNFWIAAWLLISVFILFINMFYTSFIVPIFNKLEPLADGSLKIAITNYCKNVGFSLDSLFVIDGSKRSAKANAYFSGLGPKKKVVLYDTLINDHTEDELVAVLAHEVGHYKRKHIIQTLIIGIAQTGIMLFIFSYFAFNSDLSNALGASDSYIHLNLIAFGLLYSPISTFLGVFMMMLSRKNEYEADDFAKNTFRAAPLISALKKLSANNLSNLTPHPLYVFLHYSHPTLLQRIENMEK